MSIPLISVTELRRKTLEVLQRDFKELLPWLIGLFALSVVSHLVVSQTSTLIARMPFWQQMLLVLAYALTNFYLYVGMLRLILSKTQPTVQLRSIPRTMLALALLGILQGIITGIAVLFLILPAIWLSVAYSFATFETVGYDKDTNGSLSASYKLVRGRWWGVLYRLLLPVGIMVILLALGALVLSLVFALLGFITTGMTSTLLNGLGTLIQDAFSIASLYFFTVWKALIFKSLRETASTPSVA